MGRVVIVIEDLESEDGELQVKLHADFDPAIKDEEMPDSMAQVVGMSIVKMFMDIKDSPEPEEDLGFEPPRDWSPDED